MLQYYELIYWIFLFIYFFMFLIEISDVNIESDFLISAIITFFINFGILYVIFNRNTRNLNIFLLITAIIIILLCVYYYSTNYYDSSEQIITKVRKKIYDQITYDHFDHIGQISNNIQLADPSILSDLKNLMMNYAENINNILTDNIDNFTAYELFWYMCISKNTWDNQLTKTEISYILKLNDNELRQLLGPGYDGCITRSSMIFTCFSGKKIPYIDLDERYQKIKKYDVEVVNVLVFEIENIIGSLNSPHVFLSKQQPTFIENMIDNVEYADLNDLVNRLQLGPIVGFDNLTKNEKIKILQKDIVLYNNVFHRPENYERPQELKSKTRSQIMKMLSYYTNIELINEYEPRQKWNSRRELINIICDDVLGLPKWSITSIGYCNNDNTMNINTIELHRDVNKSDKFDPTLSYGTHRNYRCYQCSELEVSFRDYDGVFIFAIPDWTNKSNFPREFPTQSIVTLKKLLVDENAVVFKELINKINEGLEFMKSAQMKIKILKSQLEKFDYEQKQMIETYLTWMFLYSMWMRFWKGPGFPWPIKQVNVNSTSQRLIEQRTSPKERDELIFIQDNVRSHIIESYEKHERLKDWIESLPIIYYDFDTKIASCSTNNIKNLLDEIALGNYCMGFGSDTILKTSYYYIIELMGHKEGPAFDNFINKSLQKICDIEYNVITNVLSNSSQASEKNKILNQRLKQLETISPTLYSFNSYGYQNNLHVN